MTTINKPRTNTPQQVHTLTVRDGTDVQVSVYETAGSASAAAERYAESRWDPAWGDFDATDDPATVFTAHTGVELAVAAQEVAQPTWGGDGGHKESEMVFRRFVDNSGLVIGSSVEDCWAGTRTSLFTLLVTEVTENGQQPIEAGVKYQSVDGEPFLCIGRLMGLKNQHLVFDDGLRIDVEDVRVIYV